MYYIYENDKPNSLYQLYINIFNVVKLEENKIIIPALPKKGEFLRTNKQYKFEKRRLKKIEKISNKTIKILNKTNCKKVVISKELKKQNGFMNLLYSQNLDIVDGRFLFTLMAQEVLEYIIEKIEIKEEDLKIAILVNDINLITLENIKRIISIYKNAVIVTRHIARLKKIQKDFYEKEGIVVAVSNNKKKALSRVNMILNFDFPEEVLNKYSINDNSIIINFNNKVRIYKKRFNGSNICNYEIELKKEKLNEIVNYDKSLIEKNYIRDIYEAQIYKNQNFNNLKKFLKADDVKIKCLFGKSTKY